MPSSPFLSARRALLFASLLIATNSINARTDAVDDLENFVNSTKTLRAEFVQVSTKPNGQKTRPILGTFELQRPGQFRFHYKAPFEQIIQSDGQTLTVFDVDLNQATQRKLSTVASFAPALAVASAKDFAALSKNFDLSAIANPAPAASAVGSNPANGLRWVRAALRQASTGEISEGSDGFAVGGTRVDLGFASGGSLSELVIQDASGQRTAMKFDKLEANPRFPNNHFRFAAPAGVNVIRP